MGKHRAVPGAQPSFYRRDARLPVVCSPVVRAWRMHVAGVCLLALAGCGGGERQDENEPKGDFPVEVVRATFPDHQKLAKSSDLVVTVRNAGRETIPDIALTVNGFDKRKQNPDLADPGCMP